MPPTATSSVGGFVENCGGIANAALQGFLQKWIAFSRYMVYDKGGTVDIRLICMDLDGTALRSDRTTISPRLEAALAEAHRRGVAVVPVTGRQFGFLPPFLRQHPTWESYAVLCNGGQIRELASGQLLHSLDIPETALPQLLRLAGKYGLPIEFSVDSTLYLTQQSWDAQLPWPSLAFHRDVILAKSGRILETLESVCSQAVEKVNLLCIPQELRDAVEADLANIAVSAVWSSRTSMEITHPEASKGNGLKKICQMLRIPVEAAMALGDSGNDESMLRTAGLGIAMGNAPDTIKAAADAVTETNENDGAALAIEEYVLK